MHLKTLSAKSRPLCLGLTVLTNQPISLQPTNQIEYATTPEYEESTKNIITAMKETQLLYKNPGPDHDPITSKEMNEAIKKLKRKKSLGPDGIPNEIFIEAEPETRNILCSIIQEIHNKENIPKSWLDGEIKRLYKGKGIKGKCSNERGITLASNFGKVYERILNERVKKKFISLKPREGESLAILQWTT